MASKGFGEDLWKNVQAVKLGKDGSIKAPVRVGSKGIVVGVDAVAKADARAEGAKSAQKPPQRSWWSRLFRR